ncbi:hypothetical protein, partial [Komagataeibacter rhaeticus]|uniref:hypothetical protein n=1 Tax=Komagataeibacter rhaeticus TaxID=215221 RepID=UPI001A8C6E46
MEETAQGKNLPDCITILSILRLKNLRAFMVLEIIFKTFAVLVSTGVMGACPHDDHAAHLSLLMPKEGRAGDRTQGGRFDPGTQKTGAQHQRHRA